MKTILQRKHVISTLLLCSLLCAWSACLKPSDSDIIISHSAPFKNGDINKALAGEPSLKLFYQAYTRLGLSAWIDSTKGYTIFAPVDSAMKAAGLDENTISSLSIDSLRKLITYHFVAGALDDLAMTSSVLSIRALSFRQDTAFDPYRGHTVYTAPLYIQEAGQLFLNGFPVRKNAPVIPASNGFIYPITRLLPALPEQHLYDVIASQPDLSLFKAALILGDSIRGAYLQSLQGVNDSATNDVYWLSHPKLTAQGGSLPTILAPTNAAFNKAGFFTVDDIRKYDLRTPTGYDQNAPKFNYPPMDSVVKRHMLYNYGLYGNKIFNALLLYSDMLHPAINNNIYNIYVGRITGDLGSGDTNMKWLTGLQFSGQQGVASVKWNSIIVSIPQDTDPAHPVRNFVATNGALYKVDQLFYPNN
ncbi:putative surface protein with fasciclin (FAS1) repeats [Chitinophaga niastensis]|uniref:Putative surface protein with fasciclin (FAS1) repeats n=1 Tax=Chitinophaga niastensis TaxID=536980 RepID=A0A2P8HP21_CHINA|nr:fasciclin domain-containing protein [Chitinophaga niastensis]PSL47969.1 putative surface protein with fasciclin (FAS1) repeats [Chitinophaga niastensis]